MAALPRRRAVTAQGLVAIFERLRTRTITDDDYATLEAAIGSHLQILELLQSKNVSIRDLRRLLGYRPSEQLKDVVGQEGPTTRDAEDASEAVTPASGSGADEDHGPDMANESNRTGHGRLGADAYPGAERVDVPHESLHPGDPCLLCPTGKVYPLKAPRQVIRIVGQEPFKAWLYALAQLRCNLCGAVFTARSPPGVGEAKYDAGAAALLALMKYGMGLPMYRLEQLQASLAMPLPDATQWDILADASRQVAAAFDELVRQAAQGEVVYNDDTFARILTLMKENTTLDPATDRTGIFTTGILATSGDRRITLFLSGRQHAGENLEQVLRQRAAALGPPIQMCDGLDRNLPGELATLLGNCLAHGRRRFVDIHAAFPGECQHVLEELAKVYHTDAIARAEGLDAAQRLALHRNESAPVMEGLHVWLQTKLDHREVEPNSGLGRAITYLLKRWARLTLFLRQAGAPLDTNIVERALKKAILHRKNSLFYKTENGARVGDLFMSLIQTCQLNQVDPRRYLIALLEHSHDLERSPADWLPWNYHLALAQA